MSARRGWLRPGALAPWLLIAPLAAAGAPTRVLVVPPPGAAADAPEHFEALTVSALREFGLDAAPLFALEPAGEPPGRAAAIARSIELLQSGKGALDRLALAEAQARLSKATEGLWAHPSPEAFPRLLEALGLLALSEHTQGKRADAAATLRRLFTLRKDYALDAQRSNPDFQRLVDAARAQASAAPTVAWKVESAPPGAEIWLDGARAGTTPATLEGVGLGQHALRLALAGHSVDERVIDAGAGAGTSARLELLPGTARSRAVRAAVARAAQAAEPDGRALDAALGPTAEQVALAVVAPGEVRLLRRAPSGEWRSATGVLPGPRPETVGAALAALLQPRATPAQPQVAPVAPAAATPEAKTSALAPGGLTAVQGAGVGIGAVAVAAAGVAGVLGVIALETADDARALPPDAWDDWTVKSTAARGLAVGADVCWGVAGAAAVTSAILLIVGAKSPVPVQAAVTPRGGFAAVTLRF